MTKKFTLYDAFRSKKQAKKYARDVLSSVAVKTKIKHDPYSILPYELWIVEKDYVKCLICGIARNKCCC